MKKSIAYLLCLMLALSLAPAPQAALAEQALPKQLFDGSLADAYESVYSIILHEGQALLLTDKALYGWKEGQAQAELISSIADRYQDRVKEVKPTITALFTHDGKPYGIDFQRGTIYALTVRDKSLELKPAMQLDWSDFIVEEGQHSYTQEPQYVLADGDTLYVKASNWVGDLEKDLIGFDLNTGAITKYSPLHFQSLTPYKEGKLLGLYFDQNRHDPETFRQYPAEPMVFDPSSDSAEPIKLNLGPSGGDENRNTRLYYDAEADIIYACNNEGVHIVSADKEPEMVARLPMTGNWFSGARSDTIVPVSRDVLLIGFNSNAFLRNIREPLKAMTRLTVSPGMMDSQALTRALIELDDIELVPYTDMRESDEDLSLQFLTGEMPLDILELGSNYNDVQRYMQKGYLLDLSGNEALKKLGEEAFDSLNPVLFNDGKLCLLPTRVDFTLMSAYLPIFEEVGRTPPKNFPELMDTVRWWAEEGHAQHEGIVLFDQPEAKNLLKNLAYQMYKDSQFGQGKPLSFDMEGFGKLMQEIDALNTDSFDLRQEDLDEEMYGMMEGRPLFMAYVGYGIGQDGPDGTTIINLSLDQDTPVYRQGYVRLIGVPATSKQPEAAQRFLAAYLNNMRPEDRALVNKDWTEPIEDPNYEVNYQRTKDTLANYQRLYEEALEGAEKRQLQKDVEYMTDELAHYEERYRYRVSEQALKEHRALMETLYVNDSLSLVAEEALSKDGYLFHMYTQGAIPLEQFIQQANDKIRLMTLEMQ